MPSVDPVSPGEGEPVSLGPLDVVGIGSPLVDVLAETDDATVAGADLVRGSMELVTLERAEAIYERMGPTTEVSGGSAANTMAGVAALGGAAGFVGKIADDALGRAFSHDLRASGVEFHPVVADGEQGGTGRCLVLETGDAERTMATHLGVATTIGPADVPEEFVGRGQLVYLEGYLWDLAPAKEALRRSIVASHAQTGSVALSLSDSFCVERHQREFLDLLVDDIDVVFGNETELIRLFGVTGFTQAVDAAEETGLLVVVTRGARGSVVVTAQGPIPVEAVTSGPVLDTTGAGDLFAAGFLYGLTHGADPERCARLGSLCAGEVIAHLGARPQRDLGALANAAGLR